MTEETSSRLGAGLEMNLDEQGTTESTRSDEEAMGVRGEGLNSGLGLSKPVRDAVNDNCPDSIPSISRVFVRCFMLRLLLNLFRTGGARAAAGADGEQQAAAWLRRGTGVHDRRPQLAQPA